MTYSAPTDKQMSALQHYVVNGNKSAAYRHAYNTETMDPKTINREAIRLFKNPMLNSMLQVMQKQAQVKVQADLEWVLRRAKLLADFNINRFIFTDDKGDAFYDFSLASDDDWYCIQEYCVDVVMKGNGMDKYPAERIKLKAESKTRALEMVAKLGGLPGYNNKLEVGVQAAVVNLPVEDYYKAREKVIEQDDC